MDIFKTLPARACEPVRADAIQWFVDQPHGVTHRAKRSSTMANECKDWKGQLQDIINRHNDRHAVKPKCVSHKTMHERAIFLFAFFSELRKNGVRNFKIPPSNLGGRHVSFMVKRWLERDLSPGTIQDYLSHLRVFASWIGKDGMILEPTAYVEDPARVKRECVAKTDRSWLAKGIDSAELIARVAETDAYVGAQLAMCAAFGCRVKESIMFRPWTDVADDANFLSLMHGTKGGRKRELPIDTDDKRTAVVNARALIPPGSQALARPGRTLEQNRQRFYSVLKKFGVTRAQRNITAHGLRHEFGNDRYQERVGSPSPVRGGTYVDRDLDRKARLEIADELGHSRENITSCYFGPIIRKPAIETPRRPPGGQAD